jgi:hypothetical protein
MEFYMIQNEKQLKKIIKETLLLTEVGKELDDVITGLEKQFKNANEINNDEAAIMAVKKNNTLLELILLLVERQGRDFENFYKNSKLIPEDSQKVDDFWNKQKAARFADQDKLKTMIERFIKNISDQDKTKDTKSFFRELEDLKQNLNNYIPKWHVLQYIFFNIGNNEFGEALNKFCNEANNFDNPISSSPGFKIPIQGKVKNNLLEEVIAAINKDALSEDDKRQILSETVESDDFQSGIERGEWGWLTGAIDTAVKFFFPNIQSVTDEVEGFFNNFEKAAGGKKNLKKVMNKLTDNVSIQTLLKKMGVGEISESDIQKAIDTIKNMRMSAGLQPEPNSTNTEGN